MQVLGAFAVCVELSVPTSSKKDPVLQLFLRKTGKPNGKPRKRKHQLFLRFSESQLLIFKTSAKKIENKAYIMSETLTSELVFVDSLTDGTEIEFDTIKSKILIHKI